MESRLKIVVYWYMRMWLYHSSPSMVCCFSSIVISACWALLCHCCFLESLYCTFFHFLPYLTFSFHADNFLCFSSPKTSSSGWIKHLSKLWMFHGLIVLSSSLVDSSSITCLRTCSVCALLYRNYISQCKINIPAVSLLLFLCLLFISVTI